MIWYMSFLYTRHGVKQVCAADTGSNIFEYEE